MKLTLESLGHNLSWKGYRLPSYDIAMAREATAAAPTWLHFGAGSLFRAFPAALSQRLLTAGLSKTGIICCESYDEELIDRVYRANDNLSILATLYADGHIQKEIIASVTESLKMSEDMARLEQIFCAPSLQMVTLTITEKGYTIRDNDRNFVPDFAWDASVGPKSAAASFFGRLAALCLKRKAAGAAPIAIVSLDNCQNNGVRVRRAMMDMAEAWVDGGFITQEDYEWLVNQMSYPLSMIDKITPHPDDRVTKQLEADGLEGVRPFTTAKGTSAAAFVNTERPQYLLIEDHFPNGHPPLEQLGIIFTSRKIVDKSAHMKACTCLNPMDTALGIYGCLLGYQTVHEEMKDPQLVNLITRMSELEAMPMVEDPGVINPSEFLHEVLSERYPNPFLPDTPQRTATDTSQKLAIRFGETLYAYYNSPIPMHRVSHLTYIPLVLAGWLRYLLSVDDNGNHFERSPDPMLPYLDQVLAGITLGGDPAKEKQLYPLLCSKPIFGANLYEVGLADRVTEMFIELTRGPGAIRETLKKYCGE
jgi:fructuronate reductase